MDSIEPIIPEKIFYRLVKLSIALIVSATTYVAFTSTLVPNSQESSSPLEELCLSALTSKQPDSSLISQEKSIYFKKLNNTQSVEVINGIYTTINHILFEMYNIKNKFTP